MAKRSRGPHPLAIASSRTAMLILDMISDFDFPDGPAVLRAARRIAPHIVRLKARAAAAKVPVIYVNDNLGAWRSDSRALLRQCQRSEAPGREVVEMIAQPKPISLFSRRDIPDSMPRPWLPSWRAPRRNG